MPLDPERALQGGLFAALIAAPTLAPLLGTPPRVYDEPPLDPIYPYTTLGRIEARPFGGLAPGGNDAGALEQQVTLSVLSQFGGLEEAKAVVAALRGVLHDQSLPLTDHRLVNLRVVFADVFRAAEWRLILGVVRLRAVTEPLV
jgi:Protein of unknown function (DUF3168)